MDDLGAGLELKKHKKLPIYIVEYHHDALQFIYRNIGGKYLPLKNIPFIHFDSHPDLLIPVNMPSNYCYNKEKLFNEISIENWILPACYAGHFHHIIWIKPEWSNQIQNGHYQFNIGENNDGKIRIDLKENYFISECLYCCTDDLKNTKTIILDVITYGQNIDNLQQLKTILNQIESPYILDIDLDYFSTNNPFLNIYNMANVYEQLQDLYKFESSNIVDPHQIVEICKKRQFQLEQLENYFKYIQEHRKLPENNSNDQYLYGKITKLYDDIMKFYQDKDVDWLLIHDAGCTCDDTGLPKYLSNNDELKLMFNNFEKFLSILRTPPIIITISRSTEDDYTPEEDVEQIQETIVDILKNTFVCNDEPVKYYLENQSE